MSNKIIGNIVGVPNPKSDWLQTDSRKSDFIKNKPTTLKEYGIKEEVIDCINDLKPYAINLWCDFSTFPNEGYYTVEDVDPTFSKHDLSKAAEGRNGAYVFINGPWSKFYFEIPLTEYNINSDGYSSYTFSKSAIISTDDGDRLMQAVITYYLETNEWTVYLQGLITSENTTLGEDMPVIADTLKGLSNPKVGQVVTVGAIDSNGNVTRWDSVHYTPTNGTITEEEIEVVFDGYSEGGTRQSNSEAWTPFVLDGATHGHTKYKNKEIVAIKLDVSRAGTLSIGRIKTIDYTTEEFKEELITERVILQIDKTGVQTVYLPTPIVVNSDEDLFIGHSTDSEYDSNNISAQFYYAPPDAKDKGFFYKTAGKNSFTNQGLSIGISVFAVSETNVVVSQEKTPYRGKKLSILGDSISTFTGYIPQGNDHWYPSQSITTVDKTWWKKLLNKLGMTLDTNNSWSGSCVSYVRNGKAPGYSDSRCKNLGNPDVIIVWMGINDFVYAGTSLGEYDGSSELPTETATMTFCEAYAVMLNKILTTYPAAEVWVCTLPTTDFSSIGTASSFPKKNKNNNTILDYNKAIKKIADAFLVNIIELDKCGITWQNLSSFTDDKLHPNIEGHLKISNKVIQELDPFIRDRE